MLRRDMQTQIKYVIGVDFGSDSVRCLIVGTADGAEIASAVAAYPRWKKRLYCDPSLNRYRQHPLDYIESLEQCVREALEKCGKEVADNICGISSGAFRWRCCPNTPKIPMRCSCFGKTIRHWPKRTR